MHTDALISILSTPTGNERSTNVGMGRFCSYNITKRYTFTRLNVYETFELNVCQIVIKPFARDSLGVCV